MTIIANYDGSGNSHPKAEATALTLTGLVAHESILQRFETGFERVLARNSAGSLHMTYLMAFRGEFDVARGWNEERRNRLIKDLFNLFGEFRSNTFRAYSCTIKLDDYRRAKREIPALRKPEDICVNFCVGGMEFSAGELSGPEPIVLKFDRNERFRNSIHQVWLKHRRDPSGWPRQVRSIASSDSSRCAIQAADLIAWIVNRFHGQAGTEPFLYWSTYLMIEHFTALYDYQRIVQDYRND